MKNPKFFIICLILIILLTIFISCSKGKENKNINKNNEEKELEEESILKRPEILNEIKIQRAAELYRNGVFWKDSIIFIDYPTDESLNSNIKSMNINTLKINWEINDFYFWNDLIIYKDKLYTFMSKTRNSYRNIVRCIDPDDGKIIWEKEIKDDDLGDLIGYKDYILIGSDNGKIYFLDKDSGNIIKEKEFIFKDRINYSNNWTDGPVYWIFNFALSKDILVVHSAAYGYLGYDLLSDKILWCYEIENQECLRGDVFPVVDEDSAYLCTYQYKYQCKNNKIFACVDLKTGKEKWSIIDQTDVEKLYSASPCIVDEQRCYVESAGGISAFDKKTGEKVWEYRANIEKKYRFPTHSSYFFYKCENVIYYPLDKLYAIDANTGKLLWADKFNFKEFPVDSDAMRQYIVWVGVYQNKLFLLSINNKGEDFGYLYVLSY